MRIESMDLTCGHCRKRFAVQCAVEASDNPRVQVIRCPNPSCGEPNHRTLFGEQLYCFLVTPEVKAVRRWQSDASVYPLTCGNNGAHAPLIVSLERDHQLVLMCPDCDYVQKKLPPVVTHGRIN
jgi:hypothetical protein